SRVAQGSVVVAKGIILEREISRSRVAGAADVVKEGLVTGRGVIVHIVVKKRLIAEGGDTAGGCVDRSSGKSGGLETHGGVASAHGVAPKRCLSHRHVLRAGGVFKQRLIAIGNV